MPEDVFLTISDLDGSSNARRFNLDEDEKGVTYGIASSGRDIEKPFTFEGTMGETVCDHPGTCPDFYFTQFETSGGTLRLPPAVTNVSSLDIAYTPITMWEDFDSNGLRAFYVCYRDTTTTPDVIVKKYDVRDDSLIDTETSAGAATETAPRLGKTVAFGGDTFLPSGDESGNENIRKIACNDVDTPTVDTYTEGDLVSSSLAVIEEDGTAKFVSCDGHEYRTASTTPETAANYGSLTAVGDSGSSIYWTLELGGFVYACKPENLYELDPGSARPLLDMKADRKNKPFLTYDDFDGHMSATTGATVFYNHRTGFWRYRKGATLNLSIDNIPDFREASGVLDVPIGLRHYATDAVGQWVYSIYKPTGFANATNCNIMSAFYRPGAARELTWRTLITRTEDLIGLKIDSEKRLWFVQNPNDPAVSAGTVTHVSDSSGTSTGTSISWAHTIASGTQRVLVVGIAVTDDDEYPNAVSFGAQSMTRVAQQKGSGTEDINVSLWSLVAPLVSTANIVATFSSSQTGIVGGASNFTGVYQSQPFRATATATGTDTTPTVGISSNANDIVVDVVAINGAPATTVGSGQTQQYDAASDSSITGSGSREGGGASVTMSWSLDASQDWATIAGSLQPGALGAASADLNYVQLNLDGSPRTVLGSNRGAASSTYEHYEGEIRFDRRMQARYIRVETENFDSTTSLQAKIHRDGGSADAIGSAITTDDWHQIDFTVGTTDLMRRGRVHFTLTTNSSYAPTVSDPRMLRGALGVRSPDIYRAVIKTGDSIDSSETLRKILRQRKGGGTIQVTESWTGVQFRADIVGLRDLEVERLEGGRMEYLTEITFERFDTD